MDPLTIIIYIIVLIFSVIIHELAHGYAADALGDPTPRTQGRLTLNPIPHLSLWGSVIIPLLLIVTQAGFILGWAKPVEFNPFNLKNRKWGPALVALAGPASNIVIAIIFGVLLRLAPVLGIDSSVFLSFASAIVLLNVLLAVFNLVPVPPLDGHHVLFALIPDKYRHVKIFLVRYSFILLLAVIFFLWPYIMPLVELIYRLIVG